jgi:signal transduction histidine kinase
MLDAFAARAAHALGTSVSISGGYATLLREHHGESLDADGLAVLGGLDGGLDRLRLFVADLLELSALDAVGLHREPLRVAGPAHAAADGLASALADAGTEVEVGPLPDVLADAALLERLFHHLLRTSVGAIGDGPGRIEISGVRRAAGARIEVTDDGPPLDHATAAALFEPFTSPRGANRATGAGVSMAIARRIAERHGGSVWAHTGRRDGCTIVVLLPEGL